MGDLIDKREKAGLVFSVITKKLLFVHPSPRRGFDLYSV